uniref:U-box domain-containing family protein n=1 Tax=Rhizophora mucronata TaxID=61149 RepID=A0A2P2Q4W7_RHIMU
MVLFSSKGKTFAAFNLSVLRYATDLESAVSS